MDVFFVVESGTVILKDCDREAAVKMFLYRRANLKDECKSLIRIYKAQDVTTEFTL